MQREWRDAVATIPVLVTVALYVDYLADGAALWVHGPRAMAVTALALGLAAGALGARWWPPLATLGTGALVFAVFALVTGDGLAVAGLVASIVVLWLVSTVRHIRAPAGRP